MESCDACASQRGAKGAPLGATNQRQRLLPDHQPGVLQLWAYWPAAQVRCKCSAAPQSPDRSALWCSGVPRLHSGTLSGCLQASCWSLHPAVARQNQRCPEADAQTSVLTCCSYCCYLLILLWQITFLICQTRFY